MKTLGVLNSTTISANALSLLRSKFHVKLISKTAEDIAECDILWAGLEEYVDRRCLEQAHRLEAIATPATGHTHLDAGFLASRGIRIESFHGRTHLLRDVRATAEHTLGLILAMLRRLPAAHQAVCSGSWEREKFRGREIFGKRIGVVGFGRLGRLVAGYVTCLGAQVIVYDPFVKAESFQNVSLETLLQTADIVTLHAALREDNRRMIGKREISLMKPGAYLVNTARGELVDEAALLESLQKRGLGGAALDVLEEEYTKRPPDDPLLEYARTHDNLILTPHIGGMTVESREKTDMILAEILCGLGD
jgi:D-3-phosphoglycerate dehydrogenase